MSGEADYKTIGVRPDTKERLEELKHELHAASFDETIRRVLTRAAPFMRELDSED